MKRTPEDERAEFEQQAEELGRICDELRPGTGPGIALLVKQAWDAGWQARAELREPPVPEIENAKVLQEHFIAGQRDMLHALLTNPDMIVDDNFCKTLIEHGWRPPEAESGAPGQPPSTDDYVGWARRVDPR